jgi:hypothetical protein
VADPVAIEVAVTWAASAGCLFYLVAKLTHERGGRAQTFLVAVLAGLLAIRGFGWLNADARFLRPTFLFATLLPLAITLFIERVLRRHHPLWVKLLGLGVSTFFFVANLAVDLSVHRRMLAAFGLCLALTVGVNAVLLLKRRNAGLSHAEKHLANLLLLVAFISVPLVLSDFRTLLGLNTVRLGGLAALLFVYVMVGSVVRILSIWMWLGRFVTLALLAFILSALAAVALDGFQFEPWRAATLRLLPVSCAWLLLTGIVVNRLAIASGGINQAFLRWLAHAPMASSARFVASLGGSPDASSFLVLDSRDLADYRAGTLARLVDLNDGVVSLSLARARRTNDDATVADSAEQWVDLFERMQMTHAFLARRDPPVVVMVSLPASTSAAGAEARLRVVQHLARHLGNA